jgi:hypothetical protein
LKAPLAWGPFQQVQGQSPQPADVLGAVILANPAGVFVEGHVQLPVHAVLHAPVPAHAPGHRRRVDAAVAMAREMRYDLLDRALPARSNYPPGVDLEAARR